MKSILVLLLAVLSFSSIAGQGHEEKKWCRINCSPDIHKENTKLIYDQILEESTKERLMTFDSLRFPLRIVYVSQEETLITDETHEELELVVTDLNYAFKNTRLWFNIDQVIGMTSDLYLEDLSNNSFNIYDQFSNDNDLDSLITIYVLDHAHEFCRVTETSISCSRTGGFSYVLSSRANNIVLSRFDLINPKIVAHEFGHFFGLYHPFEQSLFGKDTFVEEQCNTTGDLICDTPPDPGAVFEIYVNYSTCEMQGYKDEHDNEYKPLLQNYMSYYKPCYLKEYTFTPQQEMVLQLSSRLAIRKKLSR